MIIINVMNIKSSFRNNLINFAFVLIIIYKVQKFIAFLTFKFLMIIKNIIN